MESGAEASRDALHCQGDRGLSVPAEDDGPQEVQRDDELRFDGRDGLWLCGPDREHG